MNDLIKITEQNGKQAVSARELYNFLELDPGNFARWSKSNIEDNQFAEENVDYQCLLIHEETPTGGKIERKDYALTIPFAKKICMLSRTERGEELRDYFIEVERCYREQLPNQLDFSDPETVLMLAQNWKEEHDRRVAAEEEIKQLRPDAEYTRETLRSVSTFTVTQIAKELGMTANALNRRLCDLYIQYKINNQYVLYADYQDRGYVETVTYIGKKEDVTRTYHITRWTETGRRFIHELIKRVLAA